MDELYERVLRNYEMPWLVFSILRELYTFDLETVIEDPNSKTTLDVFRGFLLSKTFKTNVLYPDQITLTKKLKTELEELKSLVLKIDPESFETYILYSEYMVYILEENNKDIATDYINFKNIISFIMTIEIFQKHRLTHNHIRDMFSNYLYKEDIVNFPKELQPAILKAIVSSSPKKLINVTKKIESYRKDIERISTRNLEPDDITFAILEHGKDLKTFIPSITNLKNFVCILVQKSQKMNEATKKYMRTEIAEVLISMPRKLLNAFVCLLFKIRESVGHKITTQNQNFCLYVANQKLDYELIDLAWFASTRRNKRLVAQIEDSGDEDDLF